MLRESPQLRPSIYQVVREVCLIRGTEIPIKDVSHVLPVESFCSRHQIYTGRSKSEGRANQQLPSPETTMASPPMVGAFRAPPAQIQQPVPEIVPMRRGRPTKPLSEHTATKSSPSPLRGAASDPFAALDSTQTSAEVAPSADELSSRFPTLDQFSLLHETGSKFEFDATSPGTSAQVKNISQRVTEALADEAFGLPPHSSSVPTNLGDAPSFSKADKTSLQRSLDRRHDLPKQSALVHPSIPQQPAMISTGTMTSPTPPPAQLVPSTMASSARYRFPASTEHRSSSQPGASLSSKLGTSSLKPDALDPRRPAFLDHRAKSQTTPVTVSRSLASSRPSLEGQRPLFVDIDNTLSRSRSVNTRPRPSSAYVESNLDYLREREAARSKGAVGSSPPEDVNHSSASSSSAGEVHEDNKIASDVDFLRVMEEEEALKKKEKRSSSGSKHVKRASMPSISLSGTKTLLAGKFGDAFRRFETNTSNSEPRATSPSPDRGRRGLTPIAGSEATEGRSDDGNVIEETEDVSPEMRRELERRRLSQEERRVATGTAEYRKRLANREGVIRDRPAGGGSGSEVNRAASIQNKVQSLLNGSNNKTSPIKSAERYERSSEPERAPQTRRRDDETPSSHVQTSVQRKPLPSDRLSAMPGSRIAPMTTDLTIDKTRPQFNGTIAPTTTPLLTQRMQQRPPAPPKPKGLRTGGGGGGPQFESPSSSSTNLNIQIQNATSSQEQSKDEHITHVQKDEDNWEKNFSKRYPSLSGLEMVETEIDRGRIANGLTTGDAGGLRVKEV